MEKSSHTAVCVSNLGSVGLKTLSDCINLQLLLSENKAIGFQEIKQPSVFLTGE